MATPAGDNAIRQPKATENASPAIVAEGLTKKFGALTAVDQLRLTVFPGEIFGLVGANGAGKTTLLRILIGQLTQREGSARVLDEREHEVELNRRRGHRLG